MFKTKENTMSNQNNFGLKSKIAYAFGNLGQSAFYNAMSTFFMVYVTSVMVDGLDKSSATKTIGMITSLVVIIRLAEIFFDPIIGNIIDNTKTKWGKFKPWQIVGGTISSLLLIIIFTGVFGLSHVSTVGFAIAFIIIFVILDVFYSFRDISYWGMIPALSEDSKERGVYTALGSFTGSIGYNGLTMIVVPLVTMGTYLATGKHEQGASGWLAFAVFVAILGIATSSAVAFGTNEVNSVIRANEEHTTIKQVFQGIAHNDQVLWTGLAYLLYAVANVATGGVLFYLFKYVLDAPNEFWIAGLVPTILGLLAAPAYPILNKFIPRRYLFIGGMISMILGYSLFIISSDSLIAVIIALILFYLPGTFIQMTVILSLTDSIEYGQLKNGVRNEAVTLSIRPMLDKMAGAFSNGIVGFIAVAAGMTGTATASSITSANIHTFKIFAFYTPLVLIVLSLLVFTFKVTISEKKHETIVNELEAKLIHNEITVTDTPIASKTVEIMAPVDGELVPLAAITNPQMGKLSELQGFAIKPSDGKIYAPFTGKIEFTFSTKHTIGIVDDNGTAAIIHIGLETVKLRGAGFVTYYMDQQIVNKGDLLIEFDRELIRKNGFDDVVLVIIPDQKHHKINQQITAQHVTNGQSILTITTI